MTETLTRTYRQGTLTAAQLQSEIDYALTEIMTEDGAGQPFGASRDDLASARITVDGEGGFDPTTVLLTIVLSFASGMASEGGRILLRKILEKVKHKCGDDALGDPEE